MTIYDLSHKLDSDAQVYPGDPVFSSHCVFNVKEHGYNVTAMTLGSHTGTHLDAPCHFDEIGTTVDALDLDLLVGRAVVLDLRGKKGAHQRITWDDLEDSAALLGQHRIVLLHTGWSQYWGTPTYYDHPFLDKAAAEKLFDHGVRVLAVDTLSPDETFVDESKSTGDFGVHEMWLGQSAVIVENLTGLDTLPAKIMNVSFLPLKLTGCDGSPIRAVAWDVHPRR